MCDRQISLQMNNRMYMNSNSRSNGNFISSQIDPCYRCTSPAYHCGTKHIDCDKRNNNYFSNNFRSYEANCERLFHYENENNFYRSPQFSFRNNNHEHYMRLRVNPSIPIPTKYSVGEIDPNVYNIPSNCINVKEMGYHHQEKEDYVLFENNRHFNSYSSLRLSYK